MIDWLFTGEVSKFLLIIWIVVAGLSWIMYYLGKKLNKVREELAWLEGYKAAVEKAEELAEEIVPRQMEEWLQRHPIVRDALEKSQED